MQLAKALGAFEAQGLCLFDYRLSLVYRSAVKFRFHEFDHHIRGREVQLSGKGSLQVHFQDLTIPAIAALGNHAERDWSGAKVAFHDSQR